MSVFSVQKSTPKQNPQFNELLAVNAKIQEISGFPNQDFIIKSGRDGNLIFNTNTQILSNGTFSTQEIKISDKSLVSQDEDLIWNNEVVITDSSLEIELENLGILEKTTGKVPRNRFPYGTIIQFPLTSKKIPDGWNVCDGSLIYKEKYPQLVNILEEDDNGFLILPKINSKQTYFLIYLG
jgi:hypothetical protein